MYQARIILVSVYLYFQFVGAREELALKRLATQPSGTFDPKKELQDPAKVPVREIAFITQTTLRDLLEPEHLNSGVLGDIYAAATEAQDHDAPKPLLVTYDQPPQPTPF